MVKSIGNFCSILPTCPCCLFCFCCFCVLCYCPMDLATWIQIFGLKKRQLKSKINGSSTPRKIGDGVDRLKGNYSIVWNTPTCSREGEGSGHIISCCPRSVQQVWCIQTDWNQERPPETNGPIILCRIFHIRPEEGSETIGLCTLVYSPKSWFLPRFREVLLHHSALFIHQIVFTIADKIIQNFYPDVDVYFRTYFSHIDTFKINH